jgi:putative two-component system response regulator
MTQLGLVSTKDATAGALRDAMLIGESWKDELQLHGRDGSSFPTLTSVSSTRDSNGEVSGFVAVAVDISARKRAEEEARQAKLDTLNRLSRAVETRDAETGGHIERIGEIAAMLAERLGLAADQVELIRVSSPMHDVGKIGVPDEILLKPGKLTAVERSEMERHSQYGFDVLAGSGNELLDMAASIALTHHERVDGKGHPKGLKGEEIPIEGRIVAVADVFDALTSDRTYRKAMSTDRAIEVMREGRGTQFDERVLDLLLDDPGPALELKHRTPD